MPAHVVVGLGYGDEGKGVVTDHLVRSTGAHAVVRLGAHQAAHNVVLPDGTHHTFSQFGAGTFAGAKTILSKHMMVNPHALFIEWEKLREMGYWMADKIVVQKGALVTTPFHVAANRLREIARGAERHGSCGMGVGETVAASLAGYEIRVEDLYGDSRALYEKLHDLQRHYSRTMYDLIRSIKGAEFLREARVLQDFQPISESLEIYRIFAKAVPMFERLALSEDEHYVFELSQGVLLDEIFGFHPYTTWSKTTPTNALDLLADDRYFERSGVKVYGVMRSYMTRHGAGPFVTEAPELHERFPEAHNGHGEWQGAWRVGWTDFEALSYALASCEGEIDALAITHMDRVEGDWKICLGYGGAEFGPPLAFLKSSPGQQIANRRGWEHERSLALKRLESAEPQWAEFDDIAPGDLLDLVEAHTNIPVALAFHGPTHADARELAPA